MPKLSLDYVKAICEIAEYRKSLPESWHPYFDYWADEIAAGRIHVDKRPVNGAVEETPWEDTREVIRPTAIQLALRASYNEQVRQITTTIIMEETIITPDEEAVEEVEVSVPAEDGEEAPAQEPVEEETA